MRASSCNCLRACTPAGRRGSICRTAHLGALWTACTSVSPVRTAGMVQRVPPRPAYGATAVPLLGEQADTVAADGKTWWPRTAVVLATLVTIGYLAITRLQPSASAQSVLTGGLASHAQLPSVHARYSASGPSVHAKAADLAKPTCTNAPPKEWQPWRALNLTMTNVHPNFEGNWTQKEEALRLQSIKQGWKDIKKFLKCAGCPARPAPALT